MRSHRIYLSTNTTVHRWMGWIWNVLIIIKKSILRDVMNHCGIDDSCAIHLWQGFNLMPNYRLMTLLFDHPLLCLRFTLACVNRILCKLQFYRVFALHTCHPPCPPKPSSLDHLILVNGILSCLDHVFLQYQTERNLLDHFQAQNCVYYGIIQFRKNKSTFSGGNRFK